MTDDIVTRLREHALEGIWDFTKCSWDMQEAADEIERLRTIIQDIANAVTDEGRKPGYHKQQVNYVRTMWFPLWEAISKAVKETKRD
jgi:plasmid stabilization system protein ParE